MTRSSRSNWLRLPLLLGAAAAAGIQAWHATDTLAPKLAELPERIELFTDTEPRKINSDWIQAYRTLPRIAGRMPRNARILLLSSLMTPVQFEFYFMPRQFRKLLVFPPHLVEIVREHQPDLLEVVERRYRNLKQRNLLFSRERLAEEIQRAQFLVVFDVQEYDLSGLPRRTELVFQHENASLYKILPP